MFLLCWIYILVHIVNLNSLNYLAPLHFCSLHIYLLARQLAKSMTAMQLKDNNDAADEPHFERNLHRLQFRLTTKTAVASLRLNNQYKLLVTDTLYIDMIDHRWLSQARREIHLGESQPSSLQLMSGGGWTWYALLCCKMRENPAVVS